MNKMQETYSANDFMLRGMDHLEIDKNCKYISQHNYLIINGRIILKEDQIIRIYNFAMIPDSTISICVKYNRLHTIKYIKTYNNKRSELSLRFDKNGKCKQIERSEIVIKHGHVDEIVSSSLDRNKYDGKLYYDHYNRFCH